MLVQHLDCFSRQVYAAAAAGLRLLERQAAAHFFKTAGNRQPTFVQVDISPVEPEQLALPEPGIDGHDNEGAKPVFLTCA
jgi:hypothetical protein